MLRGRKLIVLKISKRQVNSKQNCSETFENDIIQNGKCQGFNFKGINLGKHKFLYEWILKLTKYGC